MDILGILNHYYGIVIAGGFLVGIFYFSIRNGVGSTQSSTIRDYEAAIKVRDLTITDMRTSHQKQMDSMQQQIKGLQDQVTALQQQNKALQDTVTGRDILIKIQQMLNKFEFIIPLMDQFQKNDAEIMHRLERIEDFHVSTQK